MSQEISPGLYGWTAEYSLCQAQERQGFAQVDSVKHCECMREDPEDFQVPSQHQVSFCDQPNCMSV